MHNYPLGMSISFT